MVGLARRQNDRVGRVEDVLTDLLAEVGRRHPFLLERRLELLVRIELVLFPDVVDDARELFVRQLVTKISAALDDEHRGNRVHEDPRRDHVELLPKLLVRQIGLVELQALLVGLRRVHDQLRREQADGEEAADAVE